MKSIEKRKAMKFVQYNEYDQQKVHKEVADLEDLDEGIVPLTQFIDYLITIAEEAGEDKDSLFIRSREPSDCWIVGLSVVLYKDKSPEELAKMQEAKEQQKRIEEAAAIRREKALFMALKSKFEPE